MAYIAKRMYDSRRAQGAGAASPAPTAGAPAAPAIEPTPRVLGEVLGQEERRITRQGGLGGSLLGAVLDRNHDGKLDFSDLLGLGGSAIGRV